MNQTINIIIEETYDIKTIKKLVNYAKKHRNTTIIILNHYRQKEKDLINEIKKNSQIIYYTPQKKTDNISALKQLIEKNIPNNQTTIRITNNTNFRILHDLVKIRPKNLTIPNTNFQVQIWNTKKLIETSKKIPLNSTNYWYKLPSKIKEKITQKRIGYEIK
jgi:hypothetical protein